MRSKAEKLEIFRSADIYPVISSEFCLERPPEEIFAAAAEAQESLILRNMAAFPAELSFPDLEDAED